MSLLGVTCKADATVNLYQKNPCGLAVTLEAEKSVEIPIYNQIRDRIRPQAAVGGSMAFPLCHHRIGCTPVPG